MRKLIFMLLFVPLALGAQDIKEIGNRINSRDRGRINEAITQTNTNVDNVATNVTGIATNVTGIADNVTAIALKAPIASPTFTGTTTAPILDVGGLATFAAGITHTATVTEYTTIVTIDSTNIVGAAAGDLNHADGAVLVVTAGTGYALELVSAFIIYDHATADFAGGGNDLVIQVGVNGAQVAMTGAVTAANLLTASADKMIRLGSTATELVYSDAGIISLYAGTAYTNDGGTAAGLLRVHVTYRKHTTGL